MTKYRFYKHDYDDGQKWYLIAGGVSSKDPKRAGLFTQEDYEEWGKRAGYEKEELPEDAQVKAGQLRLLGD